MFRLQVMFGKCWKWGVQKYNSLEAAEARVEELKAVGIKARIKQSKELFN